MDNVDVNEKILRLLDQLTIEEKVDLLAGRDLNSTCPVQRLGIPALKVGVLPRSAKPQLTEMQPSCRQY